MTVRWLHEDVQRGAVTYRLGRDGDVVVAEWTHVATYRSDRLPRLLPQAGADSTRVEKIQSGSARALDRALEGRWSFHGAAFALGGEGVLLVGESGAGKSTIAAATVASGGELLADDIAFVDDVAGVLHLVPGERHHWIAPVDADRLGTVNPPRAVSSNEGGKSPFAARSVADHPVPLRMVCELVADSGVAEPTLEPLRGAEAMRAISPALFLLPSEDPVALAAHFDWVARVAQETEVVRLRRPVAADPALVAAAIRHARMHRRG